MRVLAQKSPKLSLDMKDWRILKELISNVRQPLSQIAQKTLLSRQSVEYRINQLYENQLIIGSRTIIHTKKIGYKSYHIFIEVHTPKDEQLLITRSLKAQYVNAIIVYSGKYNLEISLMAQTETEFLTLYHELTSNINIRNDATLILLDTLRSEVLPQNYFPKLKETNKLIQETKTTTKLKPEKPLDHFDTTLLFELSKNATTTNIALAHQLKSSKDTIAQHIKSLEQRRYIVQYRPVINYAVLDLSINSVLIKINPNPKSTEQFEQFLKTHGSILWATKTFGHFDYLVYIITKNLDEFHDVINTIKEQFQNLIKTYEILFAFKEMKYDFMAESIVKK